MSNNKQSSIDLFIDQLEEKGDAWENVSIRRVQISIDVSEYMELKTKAKAMHKEECIKYYVDGVDYGDMGQHIRESLIQIAEKIYNETFGGNNEQQ